MEQEPAGVIIYNGVPRQFFKVLSGDTEDGRFRWCFVLHDSTLEITSYEQSESLSTILEHGGPALLPEEEHPSEIKRIDNPEDQPRIHMNDGSTLRARHIAIFPERTFHRDEQTAEELDGKPTTIPAHGFPAPERSVPVECRGRDQEDVEPLCVPQPTGAALAARAPVHDNGSAFATADETGGGCENAESASQFSLGRERMQELEEAFDYWSVAMTHAIGLLLDSQSPKAQHAVKEIIADMELQPEDIAEIQQEVADGSITREYFEQSFATYERLQPRTPEENAYLTGVIKGEFSCEDMRNEVRQLRRQIADMSEFAKRVVDETLARKTERKVAAIGEETATAEMLWQQLEPVRELTRQVHDSLPHVEADRRKAQLAWIRQTTECTESEQRAAMLRTEGMTYEAIAQRLPYRRNGKPMTREGVRQVLKRFEDKTRNPGLFLRGTYRENERVKNDVPRREQDDTFLNEVDARLTDT